MINYKRGGRFFFQKICQVRGSVFPSALAIALPCAACTAGLRLLIDYGFIQNMGEEDSILKNSACWSGFTFLVGFLIVFRTSQAYSRFWDGCTATHQMRAEWFDACSSLVSFCRYSKCCGELQLSFQHLLVRLFSMLHAAALAEIEDSTGDPEGGGTAQAFQYELLDVNAVDAESLKTVMECDSKVELIFQWIQQLLVDNISTGVLSIPPPLLSRSFQELSNGMVAFHDAIKIASIPFPFPYAQTCDALLLIHWLGTPIVLAQWVTSAYWGAVFSFMQVFIYWCLNMIAMEIENPFGNDPNDIDGQAMQAEMNRHLLLLMQRSTQRVPTLQPTTSSFSRESFYDAWKVHSKEATFCPTASFRCGHSKTDIGSEETIERQSSSRSDPGAPATPSKSSRRAGEQPGRLESPRGRGPSACQEKPRGDRGLEPCDVAEVAVSLSDRREDPNIRANGDPLPIADEAPGRASARRREEQDRGDDELWTRFDDGRRCVVSKTSGSSVVYGEQPRPSQGWRKDREDEFSV